MSARLIRLQRGFSLLEVLVALTVLGTSVLGMAMLVLSALATGTASTLQQSATNLLGDARELATVGLLNAPAISQWQVAAANALPASSDPLAAATVLTDPADASGRRRLIALRWAVPRYNDDLQAQVAQLRADWRP